MLASSTSEKSSYSPHTEAFRQRETEDKSSKDTQHRSSPANEERCSQLEPEGWKWKKKERKRLEVLSSERGFDLLSTYLSFNPEYLLLGNKEGVKKFSCDPVSIYRACSHAAEACREK